MKRNKPTSLNSLPNNSDYKHTSSQIISDHESARTQRPSSLSLSTPCINSLVKVEPGTSSSDNKMFLHHLIPVTISCESYTKNKHIFYTSNYTNRPKMYPFLDDIMKEGPSKPQTLTNRLGSLDESIFALSNQQTSKFRLDQLVSGPSTKQPSTSQFETNTESFHSNSTPSSNKCEENLKSDTIEENVSNQNIQLPLYSDEIQEWLSESVCCSCQVLKRCGGQGSGKRSLPQCQLHSEHVSICIVRGLGQYMFDDNNSAYLDCINGQSHVGHCNPTVVQAGTSLAPDFLYSNVHNLNFHNITYPDNLRQHLPPQNQELLFCNSGSEAIDLAVDISILNTQGDVVIIADNAFHGCIDSVTKFSPIVQDNKPSNYTNIYRLPIPDIYQGKFKDVDSHAIDKYIAEALSIIDNIVFSGKKIACLLMEPLLVLPGYYIPSKRWLQSIYTKIRDHGGLCIADEVQTGFGRTGSHFWSFELQAVQPDIVIIGKGIGNGFPMGVVATSPEILIPMGDTKDRFSCTNRMNEYGNSVLHVLERDKLKDNALRVGMFLKNKLINLKIQHEYIGDVRGYGLLLSAEIVLSKSTREPSRDIAEYLTYSLKEEKIMIANDGAAKNILIFQPPLCMSEQDALNIANKLENALNVLKTTGLPSSHNHSSSSSDSVISKCTKGIVCNCHERVCAGVAESRFGIHQPQEQKKEAEIVDYDKMDCVESKGNYQDLD